MKKSRYTEEQIVGVMKESEAELDTAELFRKHGISQQTFYRWKAKYGGLEVSDAQRLPTKSCVSGCGSWPSSGDAGDTGAYTYY